MKPIDITKQILAMHEDEVMNNMLEEVKNELKSTIPSDIQAALDACMQKLSNEGNVTSSNVVSFKPKSTPSIISFAETELIAASGQSLGDWFSQPMNFGGAGFILDVRKVIGSDNEVDLYLNPNQEDSDKMKKSLLKYLGKSINISILNNGTNLLTATLYIDETGYSAEGSGYLMKLDEMDNVKGKISIDISFDE